MDLKELIKWFIPCFHLLLRKISKKMDVHLTVCLFLFFLSPNLAAKLNSSGDTDVSLNEDIFNINNTKSIELNKYKSVNRNQSEVLARNVENNPKYLEDSSAGRTFGRPFKKMIQALVPLAFQMGMAATWAVVAALVGIKTLAVSLIILKVLLLGGAAKFGALFASKGHQSHGGPTPQKEIHLHIHNNGHGIEHEAISPWSRQGEQSNAESKHVNIAYDPYPAGPQTISTPYGNYMRIDPIQQGQR